MFGLTRRNIYKMVMDAPPFDSLIDDIPPGSLEDIVSWGLDIKYLSKYEGNEK